MKNDIIVTIRDLGNFRRMIDEINENVISADLALNGDLSLDDWVIRRQAARLSLVRANQILLEASEMLAEAIEE